MKKSILTIVTVVVLGIGNLFANSTENVSSKALKQFEKEFVHATNANWEANKNYYKVTFENIGQTITVYYAGDGTKLATSRNILSNQLPIKLQVDLKKIQKENWISDLFEFYSEEESGYYITLENADEKLIYRSLDAAGWELYSKQVKKN
ncbi:MAG: hypothetical protein ACXWV4_10510 [Flavitalea sp.]